MGLRENVGVPWIEEIEAPPESDQSSNDRSVHAVPPIGPPPCLLRGMLPKVDAVPKPVVIVFAPRKRHACHKPLGGVFGCAVERDHSAVVVERDLPRGDAVGG